MAASATTPSNVTPPLKSQDSLVNSGISPARSPVAPSGSSTGANAPAVSHASFTNSSAELGLPGSFPRNPRDALDHLSDQAAVAGTETTNDNENVITSAAQEFRHAVGVAATYLPGYLPGSVVDAFGSVFLMSLPSIVKSMCAKFYLAIFGVFDIVAVETTDTKKAENELHPGHDNASSGQNSGVAAENLPNSTSDVPQATKEKRDNDSNSNGQTQSTKHDQTSDLRKKAIESAALGAGIGTLGGTAAYENLRDAQTRNSDKNLPAALGSPSRDVGHGIQDSSKAAHTIPSTEKKTEYPSFVTGDPAPAGIEDNPSVADADGKKQQTDGKGAGRAAAPAAGAGAAGFGAGTAAQFASHEQAHSDDPADKSVYSDAGGQGPTFASYAPAPVITENTSLPLDAPGKYEAEEEAASSSTEKAAHTDPDGKLKKAAETGALGAGAGALGGATYEHYSEDDKDAVPSQRGGQPSGGVADKSASYWAPAATTASEFGTVSPRGRDTSSKNLGTGTASGLRHPFQAAHASAASADTEPPPDTTSPVADLKAKEAGTGVIGTGIGAGGAALCAHSRYQQDPPEQHDDSNARGSTEIAKTDASPAHGAAEGPLVPGSSVTCERTGEKPISQSPTRRQYTEKEGAAATTGFGVGTVGTAAALDKDKNAEKERYQKEHLKRQQEKESEKREKEVKKHEKDVAVVAAASDKKAHKDAEKEKEEKKRREKEQKDAEKEQEKKGMEAKRHEKEVAAATVVGGAGAAGIAGDNLAKDQDKPMSGERQKGVLKDAMSDTDQSSQQPPAHPSIKAASADPERPCATPLPGAAGPNQPAKSGADSDFPLQSESVHDEKEVGDGKLEPVPAVDLDGTGKDTSSGTGAAGTGAGVGLGAAGAAYAFKPGRHKGDAEKERDASKSPESHPKSSEEHEGDKERSRYYGTEGLQEKHGGILKSSTTVDHKKDEEEEGGRKPIGSSGSGGHGGQGSPSGGNGNGKKEGFVKHIVEKVKDKLHHHD